MRYVLAIALAVGLGACSLIVPGPDDFTYDLETDAGPTDGGLDAGFDGAPLADAGCPVMCGGECTDTSSDPANCGSCARSCFAPGDGSATCIDGSCGFTCDRGFEPVLGMCVARVAPRAIAPLSTASVTSRRPTLRWELAARSDGARVELCADPACTIVLQTIDAPGNSAAPSMDLPTGVVFWRLFARMGADVGTDPSPTWQLHVGVRTAPIDTSWGTTLDVNGDGFADVAIAAFKASSRTGRVRVYHGGPAGLATTATTTLSGPDGPGGRFGNSIASAGDVNGDGFADLIVGAPGADFGTGRAYVFYGGSGGLTTGRVTVLTGTITAGSDFGRSVAGVGDVNGDGFADVVVGAPRSSDVGAALVYHGSIDGVTTMAATTLAEPDGAGALYGLAVAGAGDVNGDGFADIVVGAPGAASAAGRARVYHGGVGGVATTATTTLAGPDGPGGVFGAVAGAGDVDGDGYADVVVGPLDEESSINRAHVYHGGPGGVATTPTTTLDGPDGMGSGFGVFIAGTGDVNGDGFDDLLVGAFNVDGGTGRAYIYHGSPSGLGIMQDTRLIGPDGMLGGFGFSVSGAGDVDGDGFADVVVGAPFASSNTGRAHVFHGGSSGLGTTPATSLTGPDPAGGEFGLPVAGGGGG